MVVVMLLLQVIMVVVIHDAAAAAAAGYNGCNDAAAAGYNGGSDAAAAGYNGGSDNGGRGPTTPMKQPPCLPNAAPGIDVQDSPPASRIRFSLAFSSNPWSIMFLHACERDSNGVSCTQTENRKMV